MDVSAIESVERIRAADPEAMLARIKELPQQVRDALVSNASPVVKLSKRASRAGTTNRLLYTGFMFDGTP